MNISVGFNSVRFTTGLVLISLFYRIVRSVQLIQRKLNDLWAAFIDVVLLRVKVTGSSLRPSRNPSTLKIGSSFKTKTISLQYVDKSIWHNRTFWQFELCFT